MTDKSHVGMGYSVCPICGIKHDEVVLLHRFLKPEVPRDNFMGFDLCPEHKDMATEFLALVEVSNPLDERTTLKPENAWRTGQIAHVRREVVPHMFNVKIPDDIPMIYIEIGVIDALKRRTQASEEHGTQTH